MSALELLNPLTTEWIEAYKLNRSTALLIDCNGDVDTGIAVAERLHSDIVASQKSPLIVVSPTTTKSIGVSDVRELQKKLSLAANTSDDVSRIAAIYHAERLTVEAQNALLKLIEELPARTLLFLIASDAGTLLDTIRSRCFVIRLLPFIEQRVQAVFASSPSEELDRSIRLADGNISRLVSLMNGDEPESIEQAKSFLTASVYERQRQLAKLQKSKHFDHTVLLEALELMCKTAMRNTKGIKQKNAWKSRLVAVLEAKDQLDRNVMTKLVLLNLSVKL